MDIKTRNRTELKSYFVKNAIPTESNFAELIDGMLNPQEDRLVKLPGDPLSIEAAGGQGSDKKALNFYRNFSDPSPAWTLSLNPWNDPADSATARDGFSISDAQGNSRLFIDRNSGHVGLGTAAPASPLEVRSGGNWDLDNSEGDFRIGDDTHRLKMGIALGGGGAGDAYIRAQGGTNKLMIGAGSTPDVLNVIGSRVGINTRGPAEALEVNGRIKSEALTIGTWPAGGGYVFFGTNALDQSNNDNYALLQDASGGAMGRTYLNSPVDIRFRINNTDKMVLANNGNIGIGTAAAVNPLTIRGNGGVDEVGITQNQVAGTAAMEFTTTDGSRNQATRLILRGRSDSANIEFYRGGRGGERLSVFIQGANGHVGIGTNDPQAPLHLPGGPDASLSGHGALLIGPVSGPNIAIDANEILARNNGRTSNLHLQASGGNVIVGSKVLNVSDLRLKEDIKPLTHALDRVMALTGVSFKWRRGDQSRSIGLIAQEVEAVFPEAVGEGLHGFKAVSYTSLVASLVEAIKEQQKQIEALRQEMVGAKPAAG